eukprot:TRINITY_DN12293_c0_g1_i1.p1 TRINITY_DN12293_c0_g1~~TRINITY_DN12293_c0_g1_i1.p1  ORF type:complete len:319 (+),score=99.17 TRINITY_DN12293_c0_g1_i1:175-1131(+)
MAAPLPQNGSMGYEQIIVAAVSDEHECSIMESTGDYIVQAILGLLAFSTLIAKWRLEAKGSNKAARRPMRVFVLDTTKQSGGFFIAHVGNMVVSSLLAANDVSPCVWYFVNIVFDTTVRVFFAYCMLQLVQWVIASWHLDPKGILDFGDYGDLYVLTCTSMKRWFFQLILWIGIVLTTVVLKGVLVWMFKGPLSRWGSFMLRPLEQHTKHHGHTLELVIVMMLVPFLLCALQLWVQDSFLQSKKRGQGLHRFDPEDLTSTSRQYLQQRPFAEPLFLLTDAMWGPDSHRSGVNADSSSDAFTVEGVGARPPLEMGECES